MQEQADELEHQVRYFRLQEGAAKATAARPVPPRRPAPASKPAPQLATAGGWAEF
jgi:methyl-accepting chemotaxis protein